MKKLVYILVAVFTMVSVNAFGSAFELHYAYPGGNAENDAVVNEIIFKDVYDHNYNTYSDASYTNEIEFKAPTCKGYKFAGYFLHWTEYGVEKSEMVFNADCDLTKYSKKYYGENDYPVELYAHWEKDTENFIWEDDGSGFYGTDKHHIIDYNSFTPWNHMVIDKIPHTYLYLHYAYPGCNKEVVNQTIYVDESSFKYRVDESFHISTSGMGIVYKDETKKEVVDFKLPEIKGYKFVAFKSESGFTIINYNGINEWFDSKAVPTPHLYGYWEKDTENYEWKYDGSGFYEKDKSGIPIRKKFIPWDYMKDEETTTDINEVEVSNEVKSNKAEGIYTLNGVKVNEITKSGIYIINGKKVVVK